MKLSLVFIALNLTFHLAAQDTLSLKECFDRAEKCRYNGFLENSNRSAAEINLRFHMYSALPSLSAFSGLSASFGRSLDQITNTFRTVQVNSQSFGINSSVNLFNGLSFFNERDKLRLINNQMEEQVNFKLNTLYNQIASLYIDLCVTQSQISMSNQRVEHLHNLLDIQQDLFSAGSITHVDTLRTRNAILKEESQLLITMQSFNSSVLRLNVLIGSDLNATYLFDAGKISEVAGLIENDEVFSLRMNAVEIKMLEVDRNLSRSRIMPSIDLNAAFGTGYSTALKSDLFDPQSSVVGYGDQLSENLFQSVGLQLSVPIFNKGDHLKNNQLRKIKEDELLIQADYLEVELNRKRLELALALDSKMTVCENLERSVANLKVIYDASRDLYRSGKIAFRELDELFMEWQTEILKFEASKFELMKLKLVR
jgi:outer membrane protein